MTLPNINYRFLYRLSLLLLILISVFNCSKKITSKTTLNPADAKILIESDPSGAEIEIITPNQPSRVLLQGHTPLNIETSKLPASGAYLLIRSPGKRTEKRKISRIDDYIYITLPPLGATDQDKIVWIEPLKIKPKKKSPANQISGRISIDSLPEGARVFLNDSLAGKTPYIIEGIQTGKYRLTLKLKKFSTWESQFEIAEGEDKIIQATLNREEKKLLTSPKKSSGSNKTVKEIEGMAYIPPGEFWIGSDAGWWTSSPRHKVYLDGFYIDKYEVSNREYGEFLKATGTHPPEFWDDPELNKPELPVTGVSWDDAVLYARWKNKRLPSEAEWEKAAGILNQLWKYPWGNKPAKANLRGEKDGYIGAAPVTAFPKDVSRYGVFNLTGNVREWCASLYQADYYRKKEYLNPTGPLKGEFRVIRGGSWKTEEKEVSVTRRGYDYPKNSAIDLGFRCVY